MATTKQTAAVTTTTSAPPTLADFPDAQVVGGAVLLDGKNMGTLLVTGEVEVSTDGTAYLAAPEVAELGELTPPAVPDPVPIGVIDPMEHERVGTRAKKEVRRVKQNQAVIDAMNAPTAEEETAFAEADAAALDPGMEPEAPPPAADTASAHGKR